MPGPGEHTVGAGGADGVGVSTPPGGVKPGGWAVRVRLTNAASISVNVASNQADLRSRVSGNDPLAY